MDELEDRLRRYRPVGPPPSLRARVAGAATSSARRRWVWDGSAVAAALAFTFYVLAASTRRDLSQELTTIDPRREAIVRALAVDLGGDEDARERPVGPWGGEGQLATAVLLLCPTDFRTGETIGVDGGRHLE